jgi:outer membrane receptor for ferrienterochelin and colicin
VGYGTQEKRDVTTAVSSASGEKMRSNSPRTVADMLVGRFPGVEVRQLSNGTTSIRIRGSRSFRSSEEPLIVVDGIPQNSGGQVLMDLSPRDVGVRLARRERRDPDLDATGDVTSRW